MTTVKSKSLLKNQSGQGMTEYLILVFIIAISSIAMVTTLGKDIRGKFKETSQDIKKKLTLKATGGE